MLRRVIRRLRRRSPGPPPEAPLRPESPKVTLESWQPLHPELRTSWLGITRPEVTEAIRDGSEGALRALLEEVHPGIYVFEPWEPSGWRALGEDLLALERWALREGVTLQVPNTMNHYGLILDQVGYREAAAEWVATVMRPLGQLLFEPSGSGDLQDHHAFAVHYGPGADRDLGFHLDDSELTFNLCLGESFSGGELYFQGVRCLAHAQLGHRPEEEFTWTHRPGQAILHAGKHRHGVHPLSHGRRLNLILWCRNPDWRERYSPWDCGPWCGDFDPALPPPAREG